MTFPADDGRLGRSKTMPDFFSTFIKAVQKYKPIHIMNVHMDKPGIRFSWHHFETLDSTNLEAERMLSEIQPPEGTLILAGEQSAGRGQGSNQWESEKDKNILMSLILYPEFLPAAKQFVLNKIISLSLLRCIRHFVPDPDSISIKWPNDLYAGKHKMAGTLIKNTISGHKIKHSVIGIGLNVNQVTFSPALPNPVSLAQISDKSFKLREVISRFLEIFASLYQNLRNEDYDNISSDYLDNMLNYNIAASYRSGNREFRGIIRKVDEFGRLMLETEQGISCFDMKEIELIIK